MFKEECGNSKVEKFDTGSRQDINKYGINSKYSLNEPTLINETKYEDQEVFDAKGNLCMSIGQDKRRDSKYNFLSPGYYTHFPITKTQYEGLIQKKAPYNCPNCYKRFKERRGFEYHLNNRCTGEKKKPRYKFTK